MAETSEVSSLKHRLLFCLAGISLASITYVAGMWIFTAEAVAMGHTEAPGMLNMIKDILPYHPFTFIIWLTVMMIGSMIVGFLFEKQIFFRKQAEMKANIDGLTGCYNHRYFQDRITAEIDRANRYNRSFSLAMFDLDDFKAFNDRCGHQEGDRLLRWFSDLCRANLRVIDVLARYGGEEFVVIMPESGAEEARAAADRIREYLQHEVSQRFPGVAEVTVSAGISTYPEHGETRHSLILDADTALYYAKQNGKNKVIIYQDTYKKCYRTTSDRLKALLGDDHMEAIEALSAAVDAKDHYTHGHSDAVTKYSLAIAERLGLTCVEVENLKAAALLHDIGKIGTPDSILRKPGPLKLDEWQVIEDHPRIGSEILEKVQKLSGIVPAVRHHHERYDGLGYPHGLSGKNIPLIARIIALADAYDAMVSDRTYRSALPQNEAVEEIKRCAGTQFDPELVDLFIDIVRSETAKDDMDEKAA